MKKIKPNPIRITLFFLAAMMIVAALLFSIFANYFNQTWGAGQFIVLGVFLLIVLVLAFVTLKTTYYTIENKHLVFHRWGKNLYYAFSDIIYIDQKKGEKTKTLGFITNKGHTIYLTCDTKGELYRIVLDKSNNLLTKEEVLKRFPKASI